MTIKMDRNKTELTITLAGRLDTMTAPELEARLESSLAGVTKLYFELQDLEYISSAGLRVLLTALQIMEEQGEMKIRHVSESVMEIFEITGFLDWLEIE